MITHPPEPLSRTFRLMYETKPFICSNQRPALLAREEKGEAGGFLRLRHPGVWEAASTDEDWFAHPPSLPRSKQHPNPVFLSHSVEPYPNWPGSHGRLASAVIHIYVYELWQPSLPFRPSHAAHSPSQLPFPDSSPAITNPEDD